MRVKISWTECVRKSEGKRERGRKRERDSEGEREREKERETVCVREKERERGPRGAQCRGDAPSSEPPLPRAPPARECVCVRESE